MVWKEIKSGKGKMWSWILYQQTDKKVKMPYRIDATPTNACDKAWKKFGKVAKKHSMYFKVKPLLIFSRFARIPGRTLI